MYVIYVLHIVFYITQLSDYNENKYFILYTILGDQLDASQEFKGQCLW